MEKCFSKEFSKSNFELLEEYEEELNKRFGLCIGKIESIFSFKEKRFIGIPSILFEDLNCDFVRIIECKNKLKVKFEDSKGAIFSVEMIPVKKLPRDYLYLLAKEIKNKKKLKKPISRLKKEDLIAFLVLHYYKYKFAKANF